MQVNMLISNNHPTNVNADALIARPFAQSGRSCECKLGLRRECDQNSKVGRCQLHNTGELEKGNKEIVSKMSNKTIYSFNSEVASDDCISAPDFYEESNDHCRVRRYKRSFLYLLRNDARSRCRPLCTSKLQLLCIWRTHYSGSSQQSGSSNNTSTSSEIPNPSLTSQRVSSISRQQSNQDLAGTGGSSNIIISNHSNQKNYYDHRGISSAHLMPSFAKRRIGTSIHSCSGNTPGTPTSNDVLKLQNATVKNSDRKQYSSPQRKTLNKNQITKLVQLTGNNSVDSVKEFDREYDRQFDREMDFENDRENNKDRCRGRERDANLNTSNLSLPNVRERRIGSGRLLPRDNWDYHTEKETNPTLTNTATIAFEKDLTNHSSTNSQTTSRLSLNSLGNQNSSNPRFEFTNRSPTSKDRSSGGRNNSEYRPESRYDARKPFIRNEYDRENLTYLRRFMSDVIGQHSSGNLSTKCGSTSVGANGNGQQHHRRAHRKDEPEWFSSGPTSQHDTIELRGFDDIEEHSSSNNNDKRSESGALKYTTKRTFNTVGRNKKEILDKNNVISDQKDVSDNKPRQTTSPFQQKNIKSGSSKSDTNNNSQNNNYVESSYNGHDEQSTSAVVMSEHMLNETETVDGRDTRTDKITDATEVSQSEENPSAFNLDAFLSVDPLNNSLVREKNKGQNEIVSRFSQWFVNDSEIETMQDNNCRSSLNNERKNSEGTSKKNDRELLVSSNDPTDMNQTNTLMEFLQRGKRLPIVTTSEQIANVKSIPSVEELEARMRKIGEGNTQKQLSTANIEVNIISPLSQLITNSVHTKDQLKHLPHVITDETQAGPIDDGSNSGFHQRFHGSSSQHGSHLPQPQDMEAFKKLLEQITPTALNVQQLPPQQQSQVNRLSQFPQQINILTTIGTMPSSNSPHMVKNEELSKFMQQHQIQSRRQQIVATGLQHSQLNQTIPNEIPIMLLNHQQRYEAQLLLQGLSRGEITQSALGHQLANPNTSPHTKEVIAAVLRESSRNTSPNVIPSQQIMSPVLGQSHCSQNIPQPTSSIMIPSPQQIPINHPGAGSQHTSHHTSGTNSGGLPQRIPSPRELQYHTQTIMQNALIKKKLEEQQENFRRRQEIQKQHVQQKPQPSPSKIDMNELGVPVGMPHQFSQTFQKKSTQPHQQPQMIQNQSQNRHLNSPTPLAFTPTSVLRKMTAEKDVVSSFHPPISTGLSLHLGESQTAVTSPLTSSALVAVNVATSNPNPTNTLHLMQYQQNSTQNAPRMILGVGNHTQQQQNIALISASHMQQAQQYAENPRINQTLRGNQIKWSGVIMNQLPVSKPLGRPILKGNLVQPTSSPTNSNVTVVQQQQAQTQSMSQSPQTAFASKVEFQQIHQQRTHNNQQQQQSTHAQKPSQTQTIIPQQPTQNVLMPQIYHQRTPFQRAQQYQIHQQYQQQTTGIHQNNNSRIAERVGCGINNNQSMSNCGSIINYQRDGGLSPTSNQLARWFSPELLAQASAGKLPPLNMNQALSLEEFEKSIQHSSTAVNN